MFITVGCEDKLNKLTEPTKPIEQTKLLHQAATDGDVEQVKLLISKGADVNAEDEEQKTPLHYAAKSGKMEVVQLLVEAGADVNVEPGPLFVAVAKDHTTVAEYLIAHGAVVNGGGGWTPLQEASYSSSIEMVELLIDKGADVNAGLWTALHGAVSEGRRDIVELLIQKGADVNAGPWTALHSAVNEGRKDIAEVLLANGADLNAKDKRGYTPLYYAICNEDLDTAKLLIDRGADIQTKDLKGYTPLHWSAMKESKEITQLLLAKGSDFNAKSNDGETPLFFAQRDVAELLIAKGADVSIKDNSGRTALHTAAENGQKDLAELLIARGADMNAKDKEGSTPLYIAVGHDYKVAELLINKGADGDIKMESGQTLLQLAQERKSIESTVPDMIFDGEPNSVFGIRIACGDVDGDGYDDIVVGGPKYDNDRGRAYLFYGGPVIDTTCDLILEGETEGDLFGRTVSCDDIDNDGYDDILIGAYGYNNRRGRAYLYWGSERASMDANPDKVFEGKAEEGACFSLSPGPVIYDIDNDGYRDIIISDVRYPGDYTGRVFLYYGSTKELMDTSYDLIFTSENSGDNFGIAIGCGDVDKDGYADLIIGARFHPGGGLKGDCIGRAYLYYGGSRSNIDAKADEIFDAESLEKNYFGQGIVCIDQNNDGFDDILIGAQGYKERQGRVYLFYGDTRANFDTVSDKVFDGEMEFSDYGFVIICGDIDGDDNSDIIIGADFIRQQVGRVYLYWDSELSGPSPKPGRIFTGENPGDWFSLKMACGDVNNDGYDDLVIGAKGYKAGSEQGRAYLYYGGPKN